MKMNFDYDHRYDDIINLPHHVSAKHPRMSASDRAAQFSPFAALTGYGDEISETARLTDCRIEPDEEIKAELNAKLRIIAAGAGEMPAVEITYFRPDDRKRGGAYLTAAGKVKRIDEYAGAVIMDDGTVIPVEMIISVEGDIFNRIE